MRKVQNDKKAVIDEVNRHLSEWDGGYILLSKRARINYHAARRALNYGLKNDTKLLSKLCTFFEVNQQNSVEVQSSLLDSLTAALREAWDGSEPHAELLQSLIKSTKPFKVRGRNS